MGNRRRFLSILALLVVQLFLSGGCKTMAAKASQELAPESLGTWMWDVNDILHPEKALDFLTSHHVTEVYVGYSPAMPKSKYRAFVEACTQDRIRVALIGAEAAWALPSGRRAFDAYLKWFEEYQEGCVSPGEMLYGMHMDVEPHQLPQWSTGQAELIEGYLSFLREAREACDRLHVALEADIPFWFDAFTVSYAGESMLLCDAAMRLCDVTLLMSYRDNARAVFACGETEIPLAKALSKKLVLAVETGKIYESTNVTFHHLGTSALYRELNELAAMVNASPLAGEIGYAIHHFGSWKNLPEGGHPKGPDYPYQD